MAEPKCKCRQFEMNGICHHTGYVPQFRTPVSHGYKVPQAIERMKNRIRSKEEIREQDGYKTREGN